MQHSARQPPQSARQASPSPTHTTHSQVPMSARSTVDRSLHSQFDMASQIASSPFHFASGTTYSLDALSPHVPTQPQQLMLSPHPSEDASTPSTALTTLPSTHDAPVQPLDLSQPLPPASPGGLGHVLLSPSGKLLPATLTPLSPLMAVRHNALGNAPQINHPGDAVDVVAGWSRPELVNALFHHYCSRTASASSASSQLNNAAQMPLPRFRSFALEAGLCRSSSTPALNAVDILFTQCTRPLSGGRNKMNEEQFFEALGVWALQKKYGGGSGASTQRSHSQLVPALEELFERYLVPLAQRIVSSRAGGGSGGGGGASVRCSEEFDATVTSLLLRYEEGLRSIFVRLVRNSYADIPRADEALSHPLLEGGWRAFCKQYGFFPRHVSANMVAKVFLATATGVTRSGNQAQLAAMSFDDFMHGVFQLAQVAFTLTPGARASERVEMALNKIDEVARELHFVPTPSRSATLHASPTPSPSASGKELVVAGVKSAEETRQAVLDALPSPNADQALDGIQSLFTPSDLSCARDLFNLYCNTASQSSYSEIMSRLAWVKLLRQARLLEGPAGGGLGGAARRHNHSYSRAAHRLSPADGDLVFNSILASVTQSTLSHAPAFTRGRGMPFNLFLLALTETARRAFPGLVSSSSSVREALSALFQQHLEPLLIERVAALQRSQRAAQMPLGAGINASALDAAATAAAAATASSSSPAGLLLLEEKDSADAAPAPAPLYPNHPAPPAVPDLSEVSSLMLHDTEGVRALFAHYSKALEKIFFQASWLGVEGGGGGGGGPHAAAPSSSLVSHAPSHTAQALQPRQSWHLFLQSKQLLSEHSLRRWLSLGGVVPTLLAHKQVTALLRSGEVGFDRTRDEFVLNQEEFRAILLRIALMAFCGAGYVAYSTPASKLELLFFLLDQSGIDPKLGFKIFKFQPAPTANNLHATARRSDAGAPRWDTAVNRGNHYWIRAPAAAMGVKALLEAGTHSEGGHQQDASQQQQHPLLLHSASPGAGDMVVHSSGSSSSLISRGGGAQPATPLQHLPQEWGHGGRSHTAIVTAAAPGVLPSPSFNTSTSVPRAPFATTMLEPFRPGVHTRGGSLPSQPPSMSPTKKLFQQTPFRPDTAKRANTKFSANVPNVAHQPLRTPAKNERNA